MSEPMPPFREGADNLERRLLEAARHDAPPDSSARARTLEALSLFLRTSVVAGPSAATSTWLRALQSATAKWLVLGWFGAAVGWGGASFVEGRTASHHPSFPRAPASPIVAQAPPSTTATVLGVVARRPASHVSSEPRAGLDLPAATDVHAEAPLARENGAGRDALARRTSVITPADPAPAESPGAPRLLEGTSLRAEALLLESVRESLATSEAGRALSLLDGYDAQFGPSGSLEEEAIVLRVEALIAVGRRDEAGRVASAFEHSHPGSSYASRLRSLVERVEQNP